jgi:GTP pyrophosphokinase
VPADQLHEKVESKVASVVKRAFGGGGDSIKVHGIDDMLVFRARCCNPIRGEKIVGYITRGKGVSVHSITCSNVTSLLYDPERRIEVEWEKGGEPGRYTVRLAIEVENRKGVLAEISSKIAGINTNITNIEAHVPAENHQGRIDMTLEISDLKHLEKVIKSLRGVTGVLAVERATK